MNKNSAKQVLDSLMGNPILGFTQLDNDCNFVWVNRKFADYANREPDYFLGRNYFDLFPNEENERIFARVQKNRLPFHSTAQPFQQEASAAQEALYWDWSVSPVESDAGEIVGLILIVQDVTARVTALESAKAKEERLEAQLLRAETLLQEVHHRVKNNFQMVSSLLRLQSSGLDDPELTRLFRESRDRLTAMSLVHQILNDSGRAGHVDFGKYIRQLVAGLATAYARPDRTIRTVITAEDATLDLKQASPCALIANELITNAFNHAFGEHQDGTIEVHLEKAADKHLLLLVSDDGIGIPPESLDQPITLGLRLVQGLIQQLHGTLVVSHENGTQFRIQFPMEESTPQSGTVKKEGVPMPEARLKSS